MRNKKLEDDGLSPVDYTKINHTCSYRDPSVCFPSNVNFDATVSSSAYSGVFCTRLQLPGTLFVILF